MLRLTDKSLSSDLCVWLLADLRRHLFVNFKPINKEWFLVTWVGRKVVNVCVNLCCLDWFGRLITLLFTAQ